ncbi:MAG: DUF1579 domain-containing protein [Planctomycetota bacterium]|nr:MAG: DUF1579 domain-containing protein [Planctomycetota bacterium]
MIALIAVLAAGAAAVQDIPQAGQTDQHKWLAQLVGEWTATSEATMAPGTEPMRMESTESVRSIGGLWILAEGSATFFGAPFTSIMTLGYDPQKKAFVGSWIDSMQTHLWTYTGKLDDAGKVLTLEAEGPAFDDPTRTAKYRDAIELKSPDHKVLTSSVQMEDGTWTTFLKADYRRKK